MSGDDELDLDIDDALAAWEEEFEHSAEAVAAPMPQKSQNPPPPPQEQPKPPTGTAKRPLYRPDPELERRAAELRKKRSSPGDEESPRPLLSPEELRKKYPSFADFGDDDEDDVATQIADMTEDLVSAAARRSGVPTKPPSPTKAPPAGMDLDLSDLLDDIEQESQLHDPPAMRPSTPELEAEEAIEKLAEEDPLLDPFETDDAEIDALLFDDDETKTVTPVPSKPPTAKPRTPTPVPAKAAPRVPPPPPPPAPSLKLPIPPSAKKSAYKPKPPAMFTKESDAPGSEPSEAPVAPSEPAELNLDGDGPIALGEPEVAPKRELPPIPTPPPVVAEPVVPTPPMLQVEEADDDELDLIIGEESDEVFLDAPVDDSPTVAMDAPDLGFDEPDLEIGDVDDDQPSLEIGDVDDDEPDLEIGDVDDDEPDLEIGDVDDDEPDLEIGDVDDDEPDLEIGDVDDDEPDLEIGDVDDDEPDLEIGDVDDDEPDLEIGDVDDEADLEIGDEPAPTTPRDHGAQTARRTVGRRKPRREVLALVGSSTETLRSRAKLLAALGEKKTGNAAARLFTGAAEILARLGDAEEARQLYRRAHEVDPTDLNVLRALRRDAFARGAWTEAAEHLRAEAELPLSAYDKCAALTLLAEIQLHRLGDSASAEQSARAAMAAHPTVATGLLLVEACRAENHVAEAFVALGQAAKVWADDDAAAVLLDSAARTAERAGREEAARESYAAAQTRNPTDLGPQLGTVRMSTTADRVAALAAFAESLRSPVLAEATRRLAALRAESETDGLALIGEATRARSLRAGADLARRANDPRAIELLERLAAATGGTERALALVDLAEARAANDDLDGADEALRDATLADEALDTVHVVREVLARRAGDASRLARVVSDESESGGALHAAAKLARAGQPEQERTWLEQAAQRGEAPVVTDVLALDVAAEQRDDEAVRAGLRRQADRAHPDRRLGPLLELAAMRPAGARVELWREATTETTPLVALRALIRTLAKQAPDEAAELALLERDAADGLQAAHASLRAGRMLQAAGKPDAAKSALQAATDLHPSSSPATWALQSLLARENDFDGLIGSYEQIVDAERTPLEAAEASIRAALSQIDPALSGSAFQRAHELLQRASVQDPVLDSLVGSAPGVDAATRAQFFEQRAAGAEGEAKITALRRAAMAYEQAESPREAAMRYRDVLSAGADAMVESALDRAELAAGEHARVASRRFDAVKAASTPEAKAHAMEEMAMLDLRERNDISSGLLSLQSILTEAPGHLPTLRALERLFMDQPRDDDLLAIQRSLLDHLPHADDVVAPARLAVRLMLLRAETPGDAVDPLVLRAASRLSAEGPHDHWLARRVLAAAVAQGDTAVQRDALSTIVAALHEAPEEQASISVALAERMAELGEAEAAAEVLRAAVEKCPEHATAVEALGRQLSAMESHSKAAPMLQQAAELAKLESQKVALYYDAGREWEAHGQSGPALEAFEKAVAIDLDYADLFERTRALLERTGDRERLAALVQRRLDAGGDGSTLVTLWETRARLAEELGDKAAAAAALKKALAIEPQRVQTLKRLAQLTLGEGDWRGAAEALIRIARLRQDRDELRWVFFNLGDIYDRHMPDAKRAEAAFRRVLKLIPDDLEALDRLAQLFERELLHDKAIDTLQTLATKEIDPDERRRHRLRLALAHERRGDPRSAEHVLDEARRHDPTDLEILKAMAELYSRQGAQSALSMHLNRAVTEFRQVLQTDPSDVMAWLGLVEVLEWRDRQDASRATAALAMAVGLQDVELSRRVDAHGAIPGAGAAAADANLVELVAPPIVSRACLEVFKMAGEAFDKALPFDQRAYRTEKPPRGGVDFRQEALRIASWFGFSDVQILLTSAAPRVCLAIDERPTILLGKELANLTNEAERAFLFARALYVAALHLTVAMRSDPNELSYLIAGLLRVYDPQRETKHLEPKRLDDVTKRIHKSLSRRVREPLGPIAYEMGGAGFDAAGLPTAVNQLANRVALLALGTPSVALNALLKVAGEDASVDSLHKRVSAMRRAPEALDLLQFSLSDAYFDARRRTGADRK